MRDRHGVYRHQRKGAPRQLRQAAARLLGWRRLPRREYARVLERHSDGTFLLRVACRNRTYACSKEEGLDNVFARAITGCMKHPPRRAVWRSNYGAGDLWPFRRAIRLDKRTVLVPEGYDEDNVRQAALDKVTSRLAAVSTGSWAGCSGSAIWAI